VDIEDQVDVEHQLVELTAEEAERVVGGAAARVSSSEVNPACRRRRDRIGNTLRARMRFDRIALPFEGNKAGARCISSR
jgi:hypothetical protein